MIGSSENNRENYPRKCFWTDEKETRVKFNPACKGYAPIGLRTTGPWIFTPLSLGSIPHSYLFTSATVRVPVHTAPKCGTEPIRYVTLHFRKSARRSFTPLQSPLLCVNRSPIRYGLRVGAIKSSPGLVWT